MEKVILTPKEIVLPEAHTLDSQILDVYQEGINSYEGRAFDVLDIFQDRKGDLAGSNCFAPLKLREFLPEGTRLATMADLGRVIEINPDFLKGFYSDTGLALRTAGDSCENNDFLAKDLAKQLKERKITLDSPKVIYFDALDLRKSQDSIYGLAYNLNERAAPGVNIIDAPELMNDMRFKTMNEKGIPIIDNKGNRNLYIKQDGLSRFCLDKGLHVLSFFGHLSDSDDDGSVIVVSGEDTSQKIKQKENKK
jgi:phage antirepressor YoqD-like protein